MSVFFFLGAQQWFFITALLPLFVTIFCAENRHKRIFTSIGAK